MLKNPMSEDAFRIYIPIKLDINFHHKTNHCKTLCAIYIPIKLDINWSLMVEGKFPVALFTFQLS